jgi:YgiT-type zinc finger domain-containing protein
MMTNAHASKICPLCGGALEAGEATIPYVLEGDSVVVVKHVPAEICTDCREAYTFGRVTDQIVSMLERLKGLHSEVSVLSYAQHQLV